MADDELIKEFEQKFAAMQKRLGFKSSLEELDRLFYLKDFIMKEGFVSGRLSRMVCGRILSTFGIWENYFHALMIPNPSSMPNVEESKMIDEADKKEMLRIMTKIRELTTRNTIVGLEGDEKEEAKLIDDSLQLWNANNEFFIKLMKKMNAGWIKSLKDGIDKKINPKKDFEFF